MLRNVNIIVRCVIPSVSKQKRVHFLRRGMNERGIVEVKVGDCE